MSPYALAFDGWARFAQRSEALGEGRALVNPDAPFVLANALWYPDAEAIAHAPAFYAAWGVSASVVLAAQVNSNAALREHLIGALQEADFAPRARCAWRSLRTATAPLMEHATVTEQVKWTQARALGEVLATVYDLPGYSAAVAQALAQALQHAELEAFVAYRDRPVGAMLTLNAAGALSAFMLESLSGEAHAALTARLTFEAEARGLRAHALSCTPALHRVLQKDGLEVWCLRF